MIAAAPVVLVTIDVESRLQRLHLEVEIRTLLRIDAQAAAVVGSVQIERSGPGAVEGVAVAAVQHAPQLLLLADPVVQVVDRRIAIERRHARKSRVERRLDPIVRNRRLRRGPRRRWSWCGRRSWSWSWSRRRR